MFLGLDLGTTNVKVLVVDRDGSIVAEGSESARAELSGLWDFTLGSVDAYQYFFKKQNMI